MISVYCQVEVVTRERRTYKLKILSTRVIHG
jgi:hypothetical protein